MDRTEVRSHRAPPWLRVHLSVSMLFLSIFIAVPVAPIMANAASEGLFMAGLISAAFSVATVGTQLLVPGRRREWRSKDFGAVIALAGLANLAFILAPESIGAMAIGSIMRGMAFGLASVLASLVILELGPSASRGRLLASYGVATTVPGIFGSSIGLAVAEFSPVASMSLALACGLLGGTLALHAPVVPSSRFGQRRLRAALPIAFSIPLLVHVTATIGYGVFVTFGPIAFTARMILPALLFFVMGMTRSLGRWGSARIVDRMGSVSAIRLSIALVCVGAATLLTTSLVTAAIGAALYGAGLGVLHNATLLRLLEKTEDAQRGLVSAAWNVSIDGGVAAGAIGVGALMSGAEATTALVVIPALAFGGILASTLERSNSTIGTPHGR